MTHTTGAPVSAFGRVRSGISLIEILVVISIIVILMALTGAALQKTRESANYNRTSESVYKLQKSLGSEIDRVNEQARKKKLDELPPALLTYCDNSEARARAVYVAMEQRKYFPETLAEANTPTYIVYDSGGVMHLRANGLQAGDVVQYAHPVSVTFRELGPGPSGRPANEESGALLYLIMSKQSIAGGGAMASAADDLSNSLRREVAFNGVGRQTFADQFNQTLGFHRWENAVSQPELASHAGNKDPLDPQNLIGNWTAYKRTDLAGLGFGNGYRVQSVYSFGRSQGDPKAAIHGFRMLQAGNKGN